MEEQEQKLIDLSKHRKDTKTIDITELSQEAYSNEDRLQVQEIVDEKKKVHER